jgi:hypothetical protein
MVDLCRPSSLLGNNKKDSNSKYFPTVFLPYSHLIDPDRQESVTAAVVAATAAAAAATSAMEQTRLEEEKLRVQAKDKKDQSKY